MLSHMQSWTKTNNHKWWCFHQQKWINMESEQTQLKHYESCNR